MRLVPVNVRCGEGENCRQRGMMCFVVVEGSVVVWQFCILDICMFRGVAVACGAFVGCLGIGTHSGRLWSTQLRYQVSSVAVALYAGRRTTMVQSP